MCVWGCVGVYVRDEFIYFLWFREKGFSEQALALSPFCQSFGPMRVSVAPPGLFYLYHKRLNSEGYRTRSNNAV